eukprot:scaffold5_cov144-Skeletonema_menzelii.AAC.23
MSAAEKDQMMSRRNATLERKERSVREKADRIRPAANFFNRPVPRQPGGRHTAAATAPASKIIQHNEEQVITIKYYSSNIHFTEDATPNLDIDDDDDDDDVDLEEDDCDGDDDMMMTAIRNNNQKTEESCVSLTRRPRAYQI